MERIQPVEHFNFLNRNKRGIEKLKCVTELGIFGITITYVNLLNVKIITSVYLNSVYYCCFFEVTNKISLFSMNIQVLLSQQKMPLAMKVHLH
jgi:hypothetical protein